MKEIKGYGSKIIVNDDNTITVKQTFIKPTFNLNDIVDVTISEPKKLTNGCLTIKVIDGVLGEALGQYLEINYLKKQVTEFTDFYNYIKNIVESNKNNPATIEKMNKPKTECYQFLLDYKGGHPDFTKESLSSITITNDKISITTDRKSSDILMSEIVGIHYENQEQIEKRITATRLVTLGVFALAFKKKKKTNDKFFTMDYKRNGIENTIVFSGKKAAEAHSAVNKLLSKYNENNPKEAQSNSQNNNLAQIKGLKELLDMGAITQEEFDIKKKELLGL